MARGSIHHLTLTVTNLDRSAAFYDRVLGVMGYARAEVPRGHPAVDEDPADGLGEPGRYRHASSGQRRIRTQAARSRRAWGSTMLHSTLRRATTSIGCT